MTRPASEAQLRFISDLARRASQPVPAVSTMDEARTAIDDLMKALPLDDRTKRAIFALIKETGKTKADVEAYLGVAGFTGVSEFDGQRAKKWLQEFTTEVRSYPSPREAMAALERTVCRPPRRPLTNPYAQQAAPAAPPTAPAVRRPMRPTSAPASQPAKAAPVWAEKTFEDDQIPF